jgi:signal transduction histidine kinase
MRDESSNIKKFLFGKIRRKLTFFFMLVGVIGPTMGIFYFYLISFSIIPEEQEIFAEQSVLLNFTAIIIIFLIALNAGVLGYFLSRFITKPLHQLYRATTELEKGNFNARTTITSGDEFEALGRAFNKSAIALGKMDEERKQLEKTKSEFISITSHELRTPITPLKAQLQMLYKQYYGVLSEKQRQSLLMILKNTDRLSKIIEDFLEISRIEAARLKFVFKKTDIRETVYETVNLMEEFAKEKNIVFEINMSKLPIINVDPDRVCQVLKNLCHNAVKFSPRDSKIEIGALIKGGFIQFSVKDYGRGMSQNDQIRIFEPFYQTDLGEDKLFGGTGLGLAICRGIVQAQKGSIWVQSVEGKGSTFYFTIPLKPVEKIEPIKVLFSPKYEIEKELMSEFIASLGPMGMAEFDELKTNDTIGKEDILNYIDKLSEERILNSVNAEQFKENIRKIFGDERFIEMEQELSGGLTNMNIDGG